MFSNKQKASFGEEWVRNYLEKEGWTEVRDVSCESIKGCDIVAYMDGVEKHIEVKTTHNLSGGIPDMHSNEFEQGDDGNWYFVADYLFVLRLNSNDEPIQLDILTKEEVDQYASNHDVVVRIRTKRLDTDLKNKRVGKQVKLHFSGESS